MQNQPINGLNSGNANNDYLATAQTQSYSPPLPKQKPDEFVKSSDDQKKKLKIAVAVSAALAATSTIGLAIFAKKTSKLTQQMGQMASDAQKLTNQMQNLQQANSAQVQRFLFPSGLNNLHLQQQNVGDCYLLSSLYALSRNKKGQEAIRNMIKVNAQGNYDVLINGKLMTVKPDELFGQHITKNGVPGFARSVHSDPGIQIIERAYARYENNFGKLTKQIQGGPKGGFGQSMMYVNGGFTNHTIEALAGYKKVPGIGSGTDTLAAQGLNGSKVAARLKNISQGDYILTAGTKSGKGYTANSGMKFYCSHAYAIDGVDFAKGTIRVVNPHDTVTKVHDISFDDFTKHFREIFVNQVK